jgi:formylglycine-generating enzyme required for sulfatase activity
MANGAGEVELFAKGGKHCFVRIPAGEFWMGSPAGEKGHQKNESPVVRVQITKPFYLGKYEVTQHQYESVMGPHLRRFPLDNLPVQDIRYRDALQFCQLLSQLAEVPVTLPTEAQWEYACRAGSQSAYSTGDSLGELDKVAWHKGNAGDTSHPVGGKKPNAWGLYDMHGNASEPCIDWLPHPAAIEAVDPVGSMNTVQGANRGGSWLDAPEKCRSSTRFKTHDMIGLMGIRLAINPE